MVKMLVPSSTRSFFTSFSPPLESLGDEADSSSTRVPSEAMPPARAVEAKRVRAAVYACFRLLVVERSKFAWSSLSTCSHGPTAARISALVP